MMEFSSTVDIDAALQTILQRKGVVGFIIYKDRGIILHTSFELEAAKRYAGVLPDLSYLGQHMVEDLDPEDSLQCLRIRSQAHEIIIFTRPTYSLAVVQNITGFKRS
ncbi:hypothetical protein WJX75_000997 [Coccomyxa subellipsoidea]|uniref:Roadblock/LAMTOR2 domain-containing protein n=1 Tax=Coccomyxa subellipsoidea TaxID=248742 RepID=A0ABR2YWY5_9CHLO